MLSRLHLLQRYQAEFRQGNSDTSPAAKARQRAAIAADVAAYLGAGGRIQQLPGYSHTRPARTLPVRIPGAM